jgi:hypothetical protein
MLNKNLALMLILPLFLFSQTKKNNGFQSVTPAKLLERGDSSGDFKGISLGILFQGQSKYPNPYYGPKVDGLFNDGAYHFTIDFYYKKFIVGFQLSDEFLYLEKFDNNGAVWKPRGFNGSYSSLTRSYWLTLGYNIISNLNVKLGVGFRSGPKESLTNKNFTVSQLAEGYDFSDPLNVINTLKQLDEFSEIDYSLSITYPIKVYGKFGLVPELGYTIKHAGVLTGISIIYQ